MTLPEKIEAAIAAHPAPNSRECYRDVFNSLGAVVTYPHFRDLMLKQGIKLPKYLDGFKRWFVPPPPKKQTAIDVALKFVNRKKEFTTKEMNFYMANVSTSDVIHSGDHALKQLVKLGHIERVKTSLYRSKVAA